MPKVEIRIVIAVALIAGLLGGLLLGDGWFDTTYALLIVAVAGVLLYAIWKRPRSTIETVMNEVPTEEIPTSSVANLEQELRRKDRGEVRTHER